MKSETPSVEEGRGTARRRVVFVILGPKAPRDEKCEAIAARVRTEFDEAGWTVRNLRPRLLSSRPSTGSRPAVVLEPTDAHAIYLEAHRSIVAVVQIVAVGVLKNPENHPTPRNTMSLERFVRYKACFIVASPETSRNNVLALANGWIRDVRCGGDNDPRCLPLHVFSTESDWVDLDSSTVAFDTHHGKANRRRDSEDRRWPKDPSRHGKQVDVVAGHRLQQGFHWDAQALRNESFMHNAREVWEIHGDGHLNVYPDSHMRRGKNSKLKYEAQRPSEVLGNADSVGARPTPAGSPKQGRRRRRRR